MARLLRRSRQKNTPLVEQALPKETIPEAMVTEDQVVAALKEIFDPEIPVNIYDMGLIYKIDITASNKITIDMTLTTPNCPAAQILPQEVYDKAKALPGVVDVHVQLVWDPPWTKENMSEAARLELNLW